MPDRYCPACGEELTDSVRYCPNCGKGVNDDNTETVESDKDETSWDWMDPAGPFQSPAKRPRHAESNRTQHHRRRTRFDARGIRLAVCNPPVTRGYRPARVRPRSRLCRPTYLVHPRVD